jgi:glutamyl-tRNA reductase
VTAAAQDLVLALVTHARHVSASERARFATRLRHELVDDAGLVLETCHRVEAYLVSSDGRSVPAGLLPSQGRLLVGEAAVRHVITVAVGRDSVVVGEDQVLHQLRQSVDSAREGGRLHPTLERLLALATGAGRRARSWRHGPTQSLADVALAAIERQAGPVRAREVLVVGAGKMGGLAVRAAAVAGASVSLTNRSQRGTTTIVATSGARVEAFDPGPAVDRFAAIVIALGGPWVIGPSTVEALAASSTLVVDLSVPAAVPSDLVERLGARLISADALALMDAEPALTDDPAIARLDTLIDATTAEFCVWLEGRTGRATAEALTILADRERQEALNTLWRRLPDLDAEARDAIERMSRHLTRRLLREPLERLGRDADGRQEEAARELFGL